MLLTHQLENRGLDADVAHHNRGFEGALIGLDSGNAAIFDKWHREGNHPGEVYHLVERHPGALAVFIYNVVLAADGFDQGGVDGVLAGVIDDLDVDHIIWPLLQVVAEDDAVGVVAVIDLPA